MTPAARIAAAITVLDKIIDGDPAEKALSNWARGNRYAGSKDRAAVRDHVFDGLRNKSSWAALGRGTDGRAIMLGGCFAQDIDPADVFTGQGYWPAELTSDETVAGDLAEHPAYVTANLQSWVYDLLADDADSIGASMQSRAPITLRVNATKSTLDQAQSALKDADIETVINDTAPFALDVVSNPRRVQQSESYLNGHVELQDAGSQAMVAALDIPAGVKVLDLCAGGGGKSLAIAATHKGPIFAHDISAKRMQDIDPRAARADADIHVLEDGHLDAHAPYDYILIDAPCSGSGAWRRAPAGKWSLTPERLDALNDIQLDLIKQAARLLSNGGIIAYGTCSVFDQENQYIIDQFQTDNKSWTSTFSKKWPITGQHDGFFLAKITKV